MSKYAQLSMNHTWLCLFLLPGCIELRKAIGHKVIFLLSSISSFWHYLLLQSKVPNMLFLKKFYTDTLSHVVCRVFGMLQVN